MKNCEFKERFERCWQTGKQPCLEDFIPKDLAGQEWARFVDELVIIDLKHRLLLGQTPEPKHYCEYSAEVRKIAEARLKRVTETRAFESASAARDDDTIQMEGTLVDKPTEGTVPASSGRWVGPYELVRPIGKGGMGTVWEAIQHSPVYRHVAIKLVRDDLQGDIGQTRFDLECQALARMEHPNIANILDAGTSDDNFSYLVMELVHGVPFDKYCDEHKLTVRERLALMLPVCRAIQHAHQKGIIHRDLKHSNVLVSQIDGAPVPKVIDFGLAKSRDIGRAGDETVVTSAGQVVGTLQYMSPEQAEGHHVDTRTDIYALGVMLYKLVTGTTPVSLSSLSSQSFVRVVEVIKSVEAPRPSERIDSSTKSVDSISALRSTKPDKLRQCLKGDLDWVVMTAIAKDLDRRYETVQELAHEIERFLNDQEVVARPPSRSYRLKKFVRRNRSLVTFVVCATLLLISGIVGTSYGLYHALEATKLAESNARVAKDEANNARAAEKEAGELQAQTEAQLYALRIQTAWNNWQLGKVESAWKTLNASASQGWEANFLRSEFSTNLQTLHGHAGYVTEIAITHDGKFFFTAGADQQIHVWQTDLLGEPQEDWNRLLAAGHKENPPSNRRLVRWTIPSAATCLAISADDKLLACADRANHITVYDLENKRRLATLGPFEKDIQSLGFLPSPDPDSATAWSLVTGEAHRNSFRDGLEWGYGPRTPAKIRLLDPTSGEKLHEFGQIDASVNALLCSPSGDFVIVGAEDGKIYKWLRSPNAGDTSTVNPSTSANAAFHRVALSHHSKAVRALAASPDGKTLASCSDDQIIRLQTLDGKIIRDFTGHSQAVTGIDFDSTGRQLASSSLDGTLRIWTVDGKSVMVCRGHFSAINSVCFRRNAPDCLTVSDDSTIRWWSAKERRGTRVYKPFKRILWQAAFSPDGKRLACASEERVTKLVSMENGGTLAEVEHSGERLCVAFAPDGESIACSGTCGKLELRSGESLELQSEIPEAHQGYIWDIQFSSDGKSILTAGAENVAKIWSADSRKLLGVLRGHGAEVASARYSPDGKFIVTAADDQLVKLWCAETFTLLHTFEGHETSVWRAIFSPCGRYIASSGYLGEMILWDVASRTKIHNFVGHADQIAGLAFTPSGDRLVSGSDDGTIRFWEVATGISLLVLRDQGDRPIVHVGFSPDGLQLVSGNSAGQLTIRRSADLTNADAIFLPSEALDFSSKGLQLLTEEELSQTELVELEAEATRCCDKYPSYQTWTVCGIARYRLHQFGAARFALLSAARLEPIQYGDPDVRPYIEGFLAMVHHRMKLREEANSFLGKFLEKRNRQLWKFDTKVATLHEEVNQTLGVQ